MGSIVGETPETAVEVKTIDFDWSVK
jgi:hypothetical protein